MKKAILIGMSGSGKTTLIQRLTDKALSYQKTQVVEQYLNFIDTPGEYLEQRKLYRALIITSVDADEIGLVQSCTSDVTWIPPSFATTFAKPIFGIVTKTDLAESPKKLEYARSVLETGGAQRIFEVSAVTGAGIDELLTYLAEGIPAVPPAFRLSPLRESSIREHSGEGVQIALKNPVFRKAPKSAGVAGTLSSPEFGDISAADFAKADQATRDMTFGLVGAA